MPGLIVEEWLNKVLPSDQDPEFMPDKVKQTKAQSDIVIKPSQAYKIDQQSLL